MNWNVFSFICSRCESLYEVTMRAERMPSPICCAIETTQVAKTELEVPF